jgi:hypothetical protein
MKNFFKTLILISFILVLFAGCSDANKISVKEFILSDKTNNNEYIDGQYVCRDFAEDVVNNAREQGLEAYKFYVHWVGWGDITHAIVVFVENGEPVYADITQADNWVYIDFETGTYKTYDIRTGELVMAEKMDWFHLDTEK